MLHKLIAGTCIVFDICVLFPVTTDIHTTVRPVDLHSVFSYEITVTFKNFYSMVMHTMFANW